MGPRGQLGNSFKEEYFAVYPLGVSGNTTKDLLARFKNELQPD